MQLILVRHGESVGNSENRLQGHNDYDLTDLGRTQVSSSRFPFGEQPIRTGRKRGSIDHDRPGR